MRESLANPLLWILNPCLTERLCARLSLAHNLSCSSALLPESEKDGEPRNQVPEEGFKSEEGWHEIFNILPNIFRIKHLGLNYAR